MMVLLRRSTLVSLALAAAAAGADRPARAADVEAHVEPGLLIGPGFPEIGVQPTVGGDVTTWWSPGHFNLGLETGAAVTWLPYGNNDGEPVVGRRGAANPNILNRDVTLLPRLMLGSRAFVLPRTWAGLFVGSSWIVSGDLGAWSVIPYPTASVAIETRLGDDGRYGIRAAFSYMHFWFNAGDALVMSTLAFTWGG